MPKNKPSAMWKLLGVALIVSLFGCAAARHDYPDSCIPYLYCPPPPLPYVAYDGCHCPTPGATLNSQQHGSSGPAVSDSDVPIEASTPSQQGDPTAPTSE
jgi:hypothetical protein